MSLNSHSRLKSGGLLNCPFYPWSHKYSFQSLSQCQAKQSQHIWLLFYLLFIINHVFAIFYVLAFSGFYLLLMCLSFPYFMANKTFITPVATGIVTNHYICPTRNLLGWVISNFCFVEPVVIFRRIKLIDKNGGYLWLNLIDLYFQWWWIINQFKRFKLTYSAQELDLMLRFSFKFLHILDTV